MNQPTTTVAAKRQTQRELKAAAALLGCTVAELLEMIASGQVQTTAGEGIVDWAQRQAQKA